MKSIIKITAIITVLFFSANVIAQQSTSGFTFKNIELKTFHFAINDAQTGPMEIKVIDENGLTLFSEYVVSPANFTRKYNLSELDEGKYFLLAEGKVVTQIQPIYVGKESMEINVREAHTAHSSSAPLAN